MENSGVVDGPQILKHKLHKQWLEAILALSAPHHALTITHRRISHAIRSPNPPPPPPPTHTHIRYACMCVYVSKSETDQAMASMHTNKQTKTTAQSKDQIEK
jgi:hypothetical protein